MRAAWCDLDWGDVNNEAIPANPQLRERLSSEYDELGGGVLHQRLADTDSSVAAKIHPNDRPRVIRALEVIESGGSVSPDGASIWDAPYRKPTIAYGLATDRNEIRNNINRRTSSMFDAGLLDEVEAICGAGGCNASRVLSVTARKLHGLSDCLEILDGSVSRLTGQERMATRTRQYAKRQDTWARRWYDLQPVEVDLRNFDADAIAENALRHVAQH
jgi:tRNA dimethylallyltransferase